MVSRPFSKKQRTPDASGSAPERGTSDGAGSDTDGPMIRTMPVAMPASVAQSLASTPLAPAERDAVERALGSLRSEFRALVGSLPVEGQTASGMARLLGIERTTCQRVVSAITSSDAGLALVSQLPGSRGLRMLIDATSSLPEGTAPDASVLSGCRAAVSAYDELIRRLAGSQTRLIKRVERTLPGEAGGDGGPGHDEQARATLFDAAEQLTGRSSDLWLAMHLFSPDPTHPDLVLDTRAHGLVGHRAAPDAVPLTIHIFGDDLRDEDSPEPRAGRFRPLRRGQRDGVLTEFSTEPVPIVRSKAPGEAVVQTIETSGGARSEPIDLIFGLAGAIDHPAKREHRVEEIWALVNFPVRRLLFDVFLHRDLARACIPALDNHLWRPDFASQTGERWQTRFSRSPQLTVLPAGLGHARTDAYTRYAELARTLFEARGADPADYVGYRCDVTYPVWRTGYRLSLDFGESG